MKINADDFKNLENGQKIRKTLKSLSRLRLRDNPNPLFQQLMALVREGNMYETVPAIYPYLVSMCIRSPNMQMVNFVVTLKLVFYQKVNLEKLSNMELRHFVAAMYNLREFFPAKPAHSIDDWNDMFKNIFVLNTLVIHSYSPDAFVLFENNVFERAFKVKCLHCGNDIHSLYIDKDKLEENTAITPASLDGRIWDELQWDDTFLTFSALCDNFKEEYFAKILPYVYGTYACSRCKKENVVMEAMLSYRFMEDPWFVPTDPFLSRLRKMAFSFGNHLYLEKWAFAQYVFGQYRVRFGHESTLAMEFILEIAEDMAAALPDAIFEKLIKQGEKVAVSGDFMAVLCRVKGGFLRRTAPELAVECYESGLHLVGDTWAGRQLRREYALYLAEIQAEAGEKALISLYEGEENQENQEFLWRLADDLVKFYTSMGNLSRAIFYQEKKVQQSCDLYGEESVIYGEDCNCLGALCLEEGEFLRGNQVLGEIFDLQKAILAKSEPLPPPLGQGRDFLPRKTLEESPHISSRGRLSSIIGVHLGHIASEQGDFPLAVAYYTQAMALWYWCSPLEFVETGNIYYYLAKSHQAMGHGSMAKSFAKKACGIYRKRLKNSQLDLELEVCRTNLPLAEGLLRGKKGKG